MTCPTDSRGALLPRARIAAAAWLAAAAMLIEPLSAAEEAKKAERPRAAQSVDVLDIKFPENIALVLPGHGGWVPAYVELKSSSGRTETVVIEGTVTSDGKKRFTTRREVEVSAGAPRRAWLDLRAAPDSGMQQQIATLEVRNRAGEVLRRSPAWSLQAFDRTVISLMVVGKTLGYVVPWPGRLGSKSIGNAELSEAAEGFDPRQLPDSPLGYACADMVIIRDLGEGGLEKAQLDALVEWVELGGCVVLIPTARSAEVFRSELAKALLGDILADPKAEDGFVPRLLYYGDESGNRLLTGLNPLAELDARDSGPYTILDPLGQPMTREIFAAAVPVAPADPAPGIPTDPAPGIPADPAPPEAPSRRIYAEVPRGKGHVGIFMLDDHTRLDQDFLQAVWGRIVGWRLQRGRMNPLRASASFQMGELEGLLRDSSRDVGLPFITGLVVVYLLLVGPGLYVFLKRKNRLPAVIWVEPLLVVVYLGVIFGTAYITKGVLTKTRLWTYLSQTSGNPHVKRQSFLTIYSGADSTYRITCPSGAVVRPLFLNQNEERPIELRRTEEGSTSVEGFRLAHWEQGHMANLDLRDHGSQGLVLETIAAGDAGQAAPAEPRAIRITSSLSWPVIEGVVMLKGEGYPFGRIEPGRSIEVPIEKERQIQIAGKRESAEEHPWRRLVAHAESSGRGAIGEEGKLAAAALLDRRDEDFRIDRMSTLKERLDLYLLYER